MRSITRAPCRVLQPFVRQLWASDGGDTAGLHRLERVLPTGAMHLVVRLSASPLTLFDDASGTRARALGHCIVGGARASFYVRSVAEPSHAVGALLHPGAGAALLGIPASELAERHTPLEALWGRHAARIRERLAGAGSLEAELALFEAMLVARRPDVRALDPVITEALAAFEDDARVAEVVRRSGFSHRTFIARFRAAVGLTPKAFCRVRRFQHAIERLGRERPGLADLAAGAGFADQAHLSREFAALAGVSPSAYRALSPQAGNHVPVRVQ